MATTATGAETRAAILDRAVDLASVDGLEGLTIGRLATDLEMSKSGLFAHFGSKQELQLATIAAAAERFRAAVIEPSLSRSGLSQKKMPTNARSMHRSIRMSSMGAPRSFFFLRGAGGSGATTSTRRWPPPAWSRRGGTMERGARVFEILQQIETPDKGTE